MEKQLTSTTGDEELNKAFFLVNKSVDEGVKLLSIEPENPVARDVWRVRLPRLDGSRYWITMQDQLPEDHFGRYRWYDQYPATNDLDKRAVLKPTAPADLQLWDAWTDPLQFHQILTDKMQPALLEKQLGSPLAALQLVVDVVDHLLVRTQAVSRRVKLTAYVLEDSRQITAHGAISLHNCTVIFGELPAGVSAALLRGDMGEQAASKRVRKPSTRSRTPKKPSTDNLPGEVPNDHQPDTEPRTPAPPSTAPAASGSPSGERAADQPVEAEPPTPAASLDHDMLCRICGNTWNSCTDEPACTCPPEPPRPSKKKK